jgi:hypothetical protein
MIGQTSKTGAGRIGRFLPPTNGAPVRHAIALLATATLLTLTACGSDTTDQPEPAAPAPAVSTEATTPSAPSTAPSQPPTLDRWVNVPCSPVGATARTKSGGPLACKQVGSDKTPEWHAVNP